MEKVNLQGRLFDQEPEQKMSEDIQKTIQTCICLIRATNIHYSKDAVRKVLQHYSKELNLSDLRISNVNPRKKIMVAAAYENYIYKYREKLVQVALFRRYMDDFFSRHLPKKHALEDITDKLFSDSDLNSVQEERFRAARAEADMVDHSEWLSRLDRLPLSNHPDGWKSDLAQHELDPGAQTTIEVRRGLPDQLC